MICAFAVSFLASFFLTKYGIGFLKKKRMGQMILEIGPEWHKKKEGTPTMGGIFFIGAFVLSFLTCLLPRLLLDTTFDFVPLVVFAFVLMNAATGFVDDYVKFMKHQNKGLTALQKLVFQFGSAALFLVGMHFCGAIDTVLRLPFGLGAWDMGVFYYLFALVFIVLVVNAVNLTDGLDGLAASSVGAYLTFVVAFAASFARGTVAVSVVGGLIGFLCFNRHPAKIFMGDTGSLFLGAVISSLAVWADMDLLLVLGGFVFLFEALSVVLQVGYFKLTHGKRLFKMAPFHHHLEKCGLSENQIVTIFVLVTVLGCSVAAFAF
ncbi:MAG: phospho-N-acetylmuramoyl-pentapeptide-transferase [Clostridia bacterium]|nr:phospho-N-acetylmuramoyl-pentapeptide-transferase [Clostridia bacterium]